ncbi:CgeB family protein [Propionibacteriaceae bacterium Y1923]|uniref:CgeB family protein n=1 Tax=Aestuariimicrobium sp. Y1814 TaxID=3418742 RepID=UPI003C1B1645
MKARRLLLVSPTFHGYWRSIESAFQQLGYDASTYCYDAAPKAEKLWNKVRHELPAKLRGQQNHLSPDLVSSRAAAAVRAARPDIVLVVRGDVLTTAFWGEVRELGAVPAMWLYDELRRMRYDPDTIGELAAIATYSSADAAQLRDKGVAALHVPLAFDPEVTPTPTGPTGEFSFIGARYGRREEYLQALVEAGLPVRAHGRDWSSHLVDRARTFRLDAPAVPAGRDLDLPDAYGVMKAGLGTLNVHGDQDGFTMRTFEASGVGAVQLVDRPEVEHYYDPGREVLVFTNPDELVRACRDVLAAPERMTTLREAAMARTRAEHTFVHRARSLEALWA